MEYTKKPVAIEAVKFNGINFTVAPQIVFSEIPTWLNLAWEDHKIFLDTSDEELKIATLEGVMVVSPGDYIIRGVKGELYPCKPDIFEMSYNIKTK